MLGKHVIADMHTHCEYSHDSVCKMEDMCLAQIEKGTSIFAVTDHFDTAYYSMKDVFSPIKASNQNARELRKKYGDKIDILVGVEIGESFWYPEQRDKVMQLCDYDVIIGSVHIVKYKELPCATSRIEFSTLEKKTTEEYVDAYFDDMLTMIDTLDFDILAHLTFPLRYINGKHKCGIDLKPYEKKIDVILGKIIEKGISLEVNTSSYEILGQFMPDEDVLKRYYDKGGRYITVGSDAHRSEHASRHLEEAIELIRKIGFKHIYYYKNRKPYAISIEK